MRYAVLFAAFLATAASAFTGGPQFVRVWSDWRDAASFMSISEYFRGRETTGGWTVLRSHPESRAGYYFLARVKNPGPAEHGTRFVVHVITRSSPDPRTYSFKADIPKGSHVFEVGLTGADWAGEKDHPVAWEFALRAADGRVLADKASFLWNKPPE